MSQEKELTKVHELVYKLKVSDAMKQNVINTIPETMMSELRAILRSNRISGTPVIANGKLVGIIAVVVCVVAIIVVVTTRLPGPDGGPDGETPQGGSEGKIAFIQTDASIS